MSNPLDVADLRERVHKALEGFLATQIPLLEAIAPELAPVGDELTGFLLDGGKRLRPAFCYWGWRGAGGADTDEAVAAAACLELLHACALIHDDVMDGSDTRRGRPSVHRRFAGVHRGEVWLGDPEAFGRSAAILLGDLCLVWADQLLNRSGLPADAVARAMPAYDAMRVELMAGQYLDVVEQVLGGADTSAEPSMGVARSMRIARFKAAKYTIERPLHIGALLAADNPALVAAYSAYGLPLGEAFQLRDDVLGVFGDPAETGKPAGDDLREGKRTVLIAIAVQRAEPGQQSLIKRLLGDPHLDEHGVADLREVITGTGALEHVEQLIADLTREALAALETAPAEPEARAVLADLARAATTRRG